MSIPTPYEDLLRDVLEHGTHKSDRTGTGTLSVFGRQMRFDLSKSFPLITTKRVHFKSVAVELLWFLRGETNIAYLKENGVSIWNEWADEQGELGPVYGYQWRSWPTPDGRRIDQISDVIRRIRETPGSRRLIAHVLERGRCGSKRWPCRPATCCFSSTWPKAGCLARCISAMPTCF